MIQFPARHAASSRGWMESDADDERSISDSQLQQCIGLDLGALRTVAGANSVMCAWLHLSQLAVVAAALLRVIVHHAHDHAAAKRTHREQRDGCLLYSPHALLCISFCGCVQLCCCSFRWSLQQSSDARS